MAEKKEDGKGRKLPFTIKYEIEETADGADVNFKLENSEEDRLFAYMVTLWDLSQLLDRAMDDKRIPTEVKADFLTAAKILKDMTQACKMKVEEKLKMGTETTIMERLQKLFKDVAGDMNEENPFKDLKDLGKDGMKPSKVVIGGDVPEEIRQQLEDALKAQFGEDIDIGNMSKKETEELISKRKSKGEKSDDEVDFDDLDKKSNKDSSDIDM